MKTTDSQRTNINRCELGSVHPIAMNNHSITVDSKTGASGRENTFFTSRVALEPVYTYRHCHRSRHSHRQSLTLCQWKQTIWWTEWVQNPICPSNSPSPLTQCKFDGDCHSDGMCKQALMQSVLQLKPNSAFLHTDLNTVEHIELKNAYNNT